MSMKHVYRVEDVYGRVGMIVALGHAGLRRLLVMAQAVVLFDDTLFRRNMAGWDMLWAGMGKPLRTGHCLTPWLVGLLPRITR